MMTKRQRSNAIWLTDDELSYFENEVENKYGVPRAETGVTDGRMLVELLSERPEWVRGSN